MTPDATPIAKSYGLYREPLPLPRWSAVSEQPSKRRTGAVTSLEDPPVLVPGAVRFQDRHDAGRRLAALLEPFRGERPVVVGIPRGGVPVAAEVARALGAPLDVVVVRKIGAPQNPEFAIGALAEGGVHVLSDQTRAGARPLRSRAAGSHRTGRGRAGRAAPPLPRRARAHPTLSGRTVILVDDGLATGHSALAAVQSLRSRGATRVILAVPVAAPESARELRRHVDEMVCVEEPAELWAVGYWYEDFRPTTDEEVAALLARYGEPPPQTRGAEDPRARTSDHPVPRELGDPIAREVVISLAPHLSLSGDLTVPSQARGVVAFAHGSGSSRLSPRNRSVASALNEAGFATLLFDLLTPSEELDRSNVFDIPLLAARLVAASAWLAERDDVRKPAARLLRRQHRRGGRTDGGCRAGRPSGRRHLARWASRPRPEPERGASADAADRRRGRPAGARAQP